MHILKCDILLLEKIDGYFVAWIDKNSLNEYLEKLPMYSRLWKFGFRFFWKCPLLISRAPSDLIDFLKNIDSSRFSEEENKQIDNLINEIKNVVETIPNELFC